MNAKNVKALSWTLDRDTAEWFAYRCGESGTVDEAQMVITNNVEQVEISGSHAAIEVGTQVIVDKVEEPEIDLVLPEIPAIIQEYTSVIFDISMEKNGETVQPNDEVLVSIPVPEHMNKHACRVFHFDDNGNVTDMDAYYEDGRMVFSTGHFSYYAVVEVGGATISGQITGSKPGTVIKLISNNEALKSVAVNQNGTYRFENVAGSGYILEVYQDGELVKQVEVVTGNEDVILNILLAILGDVDGNTTISTDDVVALLLFISMPDMFPVDAECDFDGNGQITTDDAVKLLLHISMPDMFPL